MPTAHVNGVDLEYVTQGDPSDPALLLVMGLGGQLIAWPQAFVDGLDVVITVCTSIAHLSGGLGKPTWVLLDRNPHWVWGLERADSPWYPTARLYRQTRFCDWSGPLKAVTRDLKALAKSREVAAR